MAWPEPRAGKEFVDATRIFVEHDRRQSWRLTGVTLGLLIADLTIAALVPWWPLRLVAARSVLHGVGS